MFQLSDLIVFSNSSPEYIGDVCLVFIPRGTCRVCNINHVNCSLTESKWIPRIYIHSTMRNLRYVNQFAQYSFMFNLFSKEYEDKILPWLWSFAVFTILRSLAWLFFSIVNDLIFAYNIFICLFWIILIILSVWGWLVVYSLYIELRDLSKLEDLAHLRVSSWHRIVK